MLLIVDWSKSGLIDYPFQQLYALSGLYDLQPLVNTTVIQKLGLERSSAFLSSPLFRKLWKSSKDLVLNLVVGEMESDEYQKQSSMLADRWQRELKLNLYQASKVHHFSILDYFLNHYPDKL